MLPTDPRRRGCRERFICLVREGFGVTAAETIQVPYAGRSLPGYQFTAPRPRDTIVLFDSYIEECIPMMLALRDGGFDVVAFEGPGQGAVIEGLKLPMTPDWHLPVAAVLDHLQLSNVTLVGISLGGCLVISLRGLRTARRTGARRATFMGPPSANLHMNGNHCGTTADTALSQPWAQAISDSNILRRSELLPL